MIAGWYFWLVGAVAASRVGELLYSRRNQRRLAARGAAKAVDPAYAWLVLVHGGYLAAAPLEVAWLQRPFLPWLGIPALVLLIAANAFRYWVIRTLGAHWNTEIVASQRLGVISRGPYRWMRHPNYAAVLVEVAALPLVHTAWLTALAATMANIAAVTRRIKAEEIVLMSDPVYRQEMGGKPRLIPRFWGGGG